MASLPDLAAMKLLALNNRGLKRDFLDIYELGCQHFTLNDMMDFYTQKYGPVDSYHLLHPLTYFVDADPQPMPEMIKKTDWKKVKKTILRWVEQTSRDA